MNEDMTVRRLFMFETAEEDTYTAYYAPAIGVIRIRVKYKNARFCDGTRALLKSLHGKDRIVPWSL